MTAAAPVWLASSLVVGLLAPARADVINRLPAPPPDPTTSPEPPPPEPSPPLPEPEQRPTSYEGQVLRAPFRSREIVIDVPGERTRTTKIALASVAGAGLLAGAIGLYYHLDSHSASDAVSTSLPTGRAWTAEDEALVDRAGQSRTRAAIGYAVSGGLAIAAIVGYIVSQPKSERNVIRPHAAIAPTTNGAVVAGTWLW